MADGRAPFLIREGPELVAGSVKGNYLKMSGKFTLDVRKIYPTRHLFEILDVKLARRPDVNVELGDAPARSALDLTLLLAG